MWLAISIIAGLGLVWGLGRGPNAVWGGATIGLVVGLVWGFAVGEGFALVLRGAAVGAVAGVGADLLALIPNLSREREARASLVAMGLDPKNLPEPGSPEYQALVERFSRAAAEAMKQKNLG